MSGSDPAELPAAEQVEASAVRQVQPVRWQRCQQCRALVMPAALNDLLRCLSCTGQLDLLPLHDTTTQTRGHR